MSMTDPRSAEGFALLSRQLAALDDESSMYALLCAHARLVVPAARSCGATARRRRGRLESIATTDDLARTCDELQHELGEGPCVDAALSDEHRLVDDTARDERWPAWSARVHELGVRSVLSLQLDSAVLPRTHEPLGALNVYADETRAFDDADVTAGLVLAWHGAHAIATTRHRRGLEEAAESRHLVGVAQGVLGAVHGLDLEQSFAVLRRLSNDHNVKLRDLAERVVEHGDLPPGYGWSPSGTASETG